MGGGEVCTDPAHRHPGHAPTRFARGTHNTAWERGARGAELPRGSSFAPLSGPAQPRVPLCVWRTLCGMPACARQDPGRISWRASGADGRRCRPEHGTARRRDMPPRWETDRRVVLAEPARQPPARPPAHLSPALCVLDAHLQTRVRGREVTWREEERSLRYEKKERREGGTLDRREK